MWERRRNGFCRNYEPPAPVWLKADGLNKHHLKGICEWAQATTDGMGIHPRIPRIRGKFHGCFDQSMGDQCVIVTPRSQERPTTRTRSQTFNSTPRGPIPHDLRAEALIINAQMSLSELTPGTLRS